MADRSIVPSGFDLVSTNNDTTMRAKTRISTPASVAMALALLRKSGMVEAVDSRCTFDSDQRKLTPGEVALILIGATMLRNDRIPLYRIGRMYEHMPLSGILGKEMDPESLNDHALARGLDTLYEADRDQIMWDLSERFEIDMGLLSRIFHIDQTKIRTYVIEPCGCDDDAATPEFGLDKEGRTDFRLYSANSITDEHRVIRYLSPDDGNRSDVSMDADAVDFLIGNVDPETSTVVIDSKGANANLISKMDKAKLGFVTKGPVNFSSCMKRRISLMAHIEGWTRSNVKEGHSFFDVDMMIDGECLESGQRAPKKRMRIVAFRSEKMLSDRRASIWRRDESPAEKTAKALRSKRFDSKEDAMVEVGKAQEELNDNAYSLRWCVFPEDVRVKRTAPGRPKAGECIEMKRQWKVLCKPVLDEEKLDILADIESAEILITNLPRIESGEIEANVRDGASSESVLELYLDQYKQEHTFRLLKGKVGLNDVFFKKPERENAMMFVLGLAALVRNVIDLRFRMRAGCFTTCQDMVDSWKLLNFMVVDGELEFDGPARCEEEILDVMERLDLDEGIIVDSLSMSV